MSPGALGRVLVSAVLAQALLAGPAAAGLADYVKKADPDFRWKLLRTAKTDTATVYTLTLTSQTWEKITWKHDLQVVLPKGVKPASTLFLWNTGGKPDPASTLMALDLAEKMQAPVAFLYGIPNQPLFGKLKEDALIAETFVRYLDTKDPDWPLLFPMVKSVVKAMDALQAFARDNWKVEVKQFVLSGASKRGWTTWLSAAVDPRIKAIAPLVFDTLNMQKQLPHQLASYGAYSDMIRDYTKRGLVPLPKTAEARKLWGMVDPWIYRDKLTMPKLIVNGTNDPYWTQDALNLYWDDLKGPKWICYVPNAGHSLSQRRPGGGRDLERAANTLAAFARHQIEDTPMPKLSWRHGEAGGKFQLSVTGSPAPKAARLWQADAPTRDFRKATWKDQILDLDRGKVLALVEAPTSGCRVFLVEYEYELGKLSYYLSTQLRIVGKPVK